MKGKKNKSSLKQIKKMSLTKGYSLECIILICLDLTSFMLYDNLNIDFVVRQKKGHTTIGMAFSSAFFF